MSDLPTEDEAISRDSDNAPDQHEPEECPPSDPPEHLTSELPEQRATPDLTSDETALELRTDEATAVTPGPRITTETAIEPSTEPQAVEADSNEAVNPQHAALPQNASQPRTSWISNRRSASFVRYSEDYASELITFPNAPPKPTESPEVTKSASRSLRRAHSFVRIATNEDGTARIVTDLDKTPSPPHAKPDPASFSRAAAGLRRSYSAAGLNERLSAAARGEPSPKMPRTSSSIGRSRDSRAWEFWCDPDSRSTTSLTTRAEQEGSGSAADAIGILRANRKILAQNHARQNTPLISRHGSHKVLGSSPSVKKSRGAMQRASTINGRFSTREYKKSGDTTESDEFPETTSDKENWEPEAPKSVRRDRQIAATPPASRAARHILGENTDYMSQSSSLGAMLARERRKGGTVVLDPEDDEELRGFMKGDGSARTSLSSAEEAGCVEGLLKLSQGQWR